MKIIIDMNLSPQWVSVLGTAGYEALHWSTVSEQNHLHLKF
jgi:predicted nuclease of predicted toxin-antitoxin system